MNKEDLLERLTVNNPSWEREEIENIFEIVEDAYDNDDIPSYYNLEDDDFYQSIINICEDMNINVLTYKKLMRFIEEDLLEV